MAEYLLVSTTAGSQESAADLLRLAVRERLAASDQVFGPALSAFWHLGEFGEGEECRFSSRPRPAGIWS
jgi:periplasmic divalent cation tolerance protein